MELQALSGVLIGVSAVFLAATTILSWLRFYVRSRYAKNDASNNWARRFSWFLPVAVLLFIGSAALFIVVADNTLHATNVNATLASHTVVQQYRVGSVLYLLSTALTKMSIYSLFGNQKFSARQIISWLILALALFSAVTAGFTLVPCGNPGIGSQNTCDSTKTVHIFNLAWQSSDVVLDVIMVVFASVQIVLAREKALVKRFGWGVIFLGALATGAASYRLSIYARNAAADPSSTFATTDVLLLAITAVVELGLSISVCCLVTLRPLFSARLGEEAQRIEEKVPYARDSRPSTGTALLDPRNARFAQVGGHGHKHGLAGQSIYMQAHPDWVVSSPDPAASPDPRRKKAKRMGGVYVNEVDVEWGNSPAASPYMR